MRIAHLSALKGSHFICLAGQSNANGYQTPADTAAYERRTGQYIYNNVSQQWEALQQNYNNGGAFYDYTGSVGSEMEFMRLLHEYYGADQYLFKYAVGGTSLAPKQGVQLYDWQPDTSDDQMFNGFVANYRNAVANYPAQMPPKLILIWIQGENDASGASADNYLINMNKFITALKNRLGRPDLLVLQTLLANTQTAYGDAGKATVNANKIAFSINGNRYVNIDGAEVGGDGVHFTAAGQVYIAQKVFEVYKTMV